MEDSRKESRNEPDNIMWALTTYNGEYLVRLIIVHEGDYVEY